MGHNNHSLSLDATVMVSKKGVNGVNQLASKGEKITAYRQNERKVTD